MKLLGPTLAGLILSLSGVVLPAAQEVFVRVNQVGYPISGPKLALAFSEADLPVDFSVVEAEGERVCFEGKAVLITHALWGRISRHAEMDFSGLHRPGRYCVKVGGTTSLPFEIGTAVYADLPGQLLEYMRQQRCGYNPWLNQVCHLFDGRTAYGPLTNGSYLDVRGGWHDAGDLLKYLITSGNATAQMLLAYELGGSPLARKHSRGRVAVDHVNASGQEGANEIPDLLDEARWGLEWLLKLHPAPDHLYHQVADDRDHAGLRLPHEEIADYGWGRGGYRVVYFADGRPQGLREYKSESTGVANVAGRYAAAMALAFRVWEKDAQHRSFALRCLQAGKEVYELGRAKEGVQQGNSYKTPYRYEESTWADDMEWGAAELLRATGEERYRQDALRYAKLAGSESWMGKEQTRHYQYYPFMNLGHFRLYDQVDRAARKQLAGYYQEGIERCLKAAESNPYGCGVPFIWCSANLTVALATQCALYERMTGDKRYAHFAAKQRDWLLGRNPWGYSLFTGIGAVSPRNPHLVTTYLAKRSVRGGLVDGPVYERTFKSLKGVSITEPDPLATFQGQAVYHDDFRDYASNEPTMDGTASAILLWALCSETLR